MGTRIRYFSRKCPYEAFVSGGNDVGMAAATSTVRCYDCKEIKDDLTTDEPWLAMDKDWILTEFYCDKSTAHRTELWNHPSKCPKCDRSMIVDKDFSPIMWDLWWIGRLIGSISGGSIWQDSEDSCIPSLN